MAVKKAEATPVRIPELERITLECCIIGATPLYHNAMSAKAKRDLLIGGKRKTAAEKQEIKHDPEREFRTSMKLTDDPAAPTRVVLPTPAFKAAMATAAKSTPSVTGTSVKRLIFMPEVDTGIYGIPKLKMDVVRNSDINKTPDIRTRAYMAEWAAILRVSYISPEFNRASIMAILANAGLVAGVGDFRQEKGHGSYGTFHLCSPDDPDFQRIVAEGGREAQEDALTNIRIADDVDSVLLYDMLLEEREARSLG